MAIDIMRSGTLGQYQSCYAYLRVFLHLYPFILRIRVII